MDAIATSRLALRPFRGEDWRELYALIVDKEASPYAVYDSPFPTDEEGAKAVAEYFARGDEFYAVCLPPAGELIGFVSLGRCEAEGVRNLGYCIRSDMQGQGYATEACRAIIRHAARNLGARTLVSGTADQNAPSVAVLGKLGFVRTGSAKGAFRTDGRGAPVEFMGGSYELYIGGEK